MIKFLVVFALIFALAVSDDSVNVAVFAEVGIDVDLSNPLPNSTLMENVTDGSSVFDVEDQLKIELGDFLSIDLSIFDSLQTTLITRLQGLLSLFPTTTTESQLEEHYQNATDRCSTLEARWESVKANFSAEIDAHLTELRTAIQECETEAKEIGSKVNGTTEEIRLRVLAAFRLYRARMKRAYHGALLTCRRHSSYAAEMEVSSAILEKAVFQAALSIKAGNFTNHTDGEYKSALTAALEVVARRRIASQKAREQGEKAFDVFEKLREKYDKLEERFQEKSDEIEGEIRSTIDELRSKWKNATEEAKERIQTGLSQVIDRVRNVTCELKNVAESAGNLGAKIVIKRIADANKTKEQVVEEIRARVIAYLCAETNVARSDIKVNVSAKASAKRAEGDEEEYEATADFASDSDSPSSSPNPTPSSSVPPTNIPTSPVPSGATGLFVTAAALVPALFLL